MGMFDRTCFLTGSIKLCKNFCFDIYMLFNAKNNYICQKI
jgi:hypothetical protein